MTFEGRETVHVFEHDAQVVQALADEFQRLSELKHTTHIALSGGSTPKLLFEFISCSAYRESIAWHNLHFWWGDERCVPSSSADSNYGEALRHLFAKIEIDDEHIHPIDGALLPEQARLKFCRALEQHLPWVNSMPRFDWIICGVGEDGHTASLFPGAVDYNSERSAVLACHPESGQYRVSLSARALANAKRLSYLALGENKQQVLACVLNPIDDFQASLPAAFIRANDGQTEFFLDRAAAQCLPSTVLKL